MSRIVKYLIGILLLIVAIFFIAGMLHDPAGAATKKKPITKIEVVTDWNREDRYRFIREIKVNGRPCIQTTDGITCQWGYGP